MVIVAAGEVNAVILAMSVSLPVMSNIVQIGDLVMSNVVLYVVVSVLFSEIRSLVGIAVLKVLSSDLVT